MLTSIYSRDLLLRQLHTRKRWDFIIVGGGATGLGIAVDAASRGYSALLLEQHDFAKGTSSRSTKLIHGGVRYLAQGNIKLVYSALKERGLLLRNAPHLVRSQSFIIPCYSNFEVLKYTAGLKFYDLLAGTYSFGKSAFISSKEVLKYFPNIKKDGLKGGVQYYDGQFDDSRLAINLAQTAIEHAAVVLNYVKVTGLIKTNGRISGVNATDIESDRTYTLEASVVINATGVFVDDILRLDNPARKQLVKPSQGIHLVFDRRYLDSEHALMIPKTSDGRVLFVVPWHDHLVVGTTDTPLNENAIEPRALESEVRFILDNVNRYLNDPPGKEDILSVFAGLRPLAATSKNSQATKEISRDHKLIVSDSGLVTIIGGKWTTYRKMAQETVDKSIASGNLAYLECKTEKLLIHGAESAPATDRSFYGSDKEKISLLMMQYPLLGDLLVKGHPYRGGEVVWAVRYEMARTIEDVLARRLRLLFLDANAAIEAAPTVARLMMQELELDENWKRTQIDQFTELATQYL